MSALDIPMPKSWVLSPSTTAYPHDIPINVGAKPLGNFAVPLPLGSNTVRVTWDGSTSLTIHRRVGDDSGTSTEIYTIPAGSGTRSVVLDVPSRVAGELLRFRVPSPLQSDVDNARASVLLIHTPPAT